MNKRMGLIKCFILSTVAFSFLGLFHIVTPASADILPHFDFSESTWKLAQNQVNSAASAGAEAVAPINQHSKQQLMQAANVANNTISTNPAQAMPLGQNAAAMITQSATDIVNKVALKKTFSDATLTSQAKLYDNPINDVALDTVPNDNTQVQTANYLVRGRVPTMYNNNLYYVAQDSVHPANVNATSLTNNTFTQRYHYNIPKGFMNDIQSIIKIGNTWNIYYLANDQKDSGSDTEWYLVQTKDFKTFHNVGVAIHRNQGGWESVATGSVMKNDQNGHIVNANLPANAILAFFTGYSQGRQNIYEAYSTDGGASFEPANANGQPLLNQYIQTGAFRDPKVIWDAGQNKIVMYISQGNDSGGGSQIRTYSSPNGSPNTWTDVGNSLSFTPNMTDSAPGKIECPNLIRNVYDHATHQEKSILFFSGDGGQDGKGLYYQVGHVNANGLFVADDKTIRRIDNGADDYSANYEAMDAKGKQIVMVGWIGNWNHDYNNFMNSNHNYHIGSFTLPRRLTLKNNVLNETFIEPYSRRYLHRKKSHGLILKGANTSSKIVVTFKKPVTQNIFAMVQTDTTTNVNVFSNGKHQSQNNVTISQPFSQLGGADDLSNSLDYPAKKFVFYIDKSSIEVAIPELGKVYTVLKLSTDNKLKFHTQHQASISAYRFN